MNFDRSAFSSKLVIKTKKTLLINRLTGFFVPDPQLITNQIYLGFKKLYDLKPILESAGLYPIPSNNQTQRIGI